MARRFACAIEGATTKWNGQMAQTRQDDRRQDTHFGFRTVGLHEKQGLVDDVFTRSPRATT